MLNKDSYKLGIILGFIAPPIAFWLYYMLRVGNVNPIPFIIKVKEIHMSSAVLSLSLLANLAIFFLYINAKKDQTSRGVLFSTIIYAILGFLLKFFL